MPSSAVRTFSDSDDYAASVRGAQVELSVIERGQFVGKITQIDLHRLRIARFSDNLARIVHADFVAGRAAFTIRTHPGPRLLIGAAEINPTNVIRHSEARNGTFFSGQPASLPRVLCRCRLRKWLSSGQRLADAT
jgi:hypothetical protein